MEAAGLRGEECHATENLSAQTKQIGRAKAKNSQDTRGMRAEMSPSKLKPDLREDEPRLPAAVLVPAPVKG
ncbi:hypothetical protein LEMLEM_LOCUS22828 [Lemmus lemmus]